MSVLDLYAGSGSLGIEALSRGASSAIFVEKSRQALRFLHGNLPESDDYNCELIQQDVFVYLDQANRSFDLIFCDPPYNKVDYDKLVDAFNHSEAVGNDTIIMLEADRFHKFHCPEGLLLFDQRRFGDNLIYFYQRVKTG